MLSIKNKLMIIDNNRFYCVMMSLRLCDHYTQTRFCWVPAAWFWPHTLIIWVPHWAWTFVGLHTECWSHVQCSGFWVLSGAAGGFSLGSALLLNLNVPSWFSFSSLCWKWSVGLLGAHVQPSHSDWLAWTCTHVVLFRSLLTYRPPPCSHDGFM